jgi:hypothetical protein
MLASSPRKIPKLSTSISVAVFVKQLVEGGRDTLYTHGKVELCIRV